MNRPRGQRAPHGHARSHDPALLWIKWTWWAIDLYHVDFIGARHWRLANCFDLTSDWLAINLQKHHRPDFWRSPGSQPQVRSDCLVPSNELDLVSHNANLLCG